MRRRSHKTRRKTKKIDLSNPGGLTKEDRQLLYLLVIQRKFKKYNKNITYTVSKNKVDYKIELTNDVLAYRNGVGKQLKKRIGRHGNKKKLEHLWVVYSKTVGKGANGKVKDIEWDGQLNEEKETVDFQMLKRPLAVKAIHDIDGNQEKACKKETKNNKVIHGQGKRITRSPSAKRREKGRETRDNGEVFDYTHHIIMKKFVGIDLQEYITKKKQDDLVTLVTIARNISQSLYENFHKHKTGRKGRVHNDIKPANIMLDPETLEVKICDLGGTRKRKERGTVEFTDGYDAPETHKKGYDPDYPKDIYALGETFRRLFRTRNVNRNKQIKKLIKDMCSTDPKQRPNISKVLEKLNEMLQQLESAPLARSRDDLDLLSQRRQQIRRKAKAAQGKSGRHSDGDVDKFGISESQVRINRQGSSSARVSDSELAQDVREILGRLSGSSSDESDQRAKREGAIQVNEGDQDERTPLLSGRGKKQSYMSLLIDGKVRGLWKRYRQQSIAKQLAIPTLLLITFPVSVPAVSYYFLTLGIAKACDACSGKSSNTPNMTS